MSDELAVVSNGLDVVDAPPINEEYERLRRFIGYMRDFGIHAHMVVEIAKDVFTGATVLPEGEDGIVLAAFRTAYSDVVEDLDVLSLFTKALSGDKTHEMDLEKVAKGGASLAFLVRYAKRLPRDILPEDCIPSDQTVATVLRVFHQITRKQIEGDE